ncbi:MerR family transcriptional regulator [Falsibacillus albus]|uniref:MerR family transcriptional regulator n=1 Tax=Falsibacillus albus TaxID=2478915 RepID=A0A3L7K0S1_9BACI|nr:MerR family transcriptional regulator [Falsibacillus albus]RLQ96663.1 MerR family transcriptional regulator [Falsibacillus albus]
MYAIRDVSNMLNVSAHTLRYYEKEEILAPGRNEYGERVYNDTDVKWLRFVMKLKETHMPIAQIREYARLVKEGDHTSQERLELLEKHQQAIQSQIENLISTEKMLEDKISSYKNFLMENSRGAK